VYLLNAMDAEARHGEAEVTELAHAPAVSPGKTDDEQVALTGGAEPPKHARRFSARRNAHSDVAFASELLS